MTPVLRPRRRPAAARLRSPGRWWHRFRRRLRAGDDAGITLTEMVVSMAVLSIFMALTTTGIVEMHRARNQSQAGADAQSQINQVFQRLDKQVRYAAGISTPGLVGADTYVEYLTTTTGTPVCTQLRLRSGSRELQQRQWDQGAGTVQPGPWTRLAYGVRSTRPFTVLDPDPLRNIHFQRLRLRLTAEAEAGARSRTRETDVTFTALNTSLSTSSASVCTEGRLLP